MINTLQQSRMSAWLCTRLGLELPPPLTCIGSTRDNYFVGVVGFSDYNGASMQMHVAGEGNWATKDLLRLAFDYPFNQCGVKVLLAYVAATNLKSVAMCHHVGFTIEHVITDAHPDGDLLIFAMRPEKCRYLKRGNRHGIKKQFFTCAA